ncbi:MAG TPA: hypothetical protein VGR62_15030 [Candidatus Binatia bacterium]|jgi:hypothetical protein|nr:hypothetical protein [Candidatus Binatia bacterium]
MGIGWLDDTKRSNVASTGITGPTATVYRACETSAAGSVQPPPYAPGQPSDRRARWQHPAIVSSSSPKSIDIELRCPPRSVRRCRRTYPITSSSRYELRAAASLARFWGEQRRRTEALDLLVPVYGWFTEGFDTADLKQAKALLDQLA